MSDNFPSLSNHKLTLFRWEDLDFDSTDEELDTLIR